MSERDGLFPRVAVLGVAGVARLVDVLDPEEVAELVRRDDVLELELLRRVSGLPARGFQGALCRRS